MHNAPQSCRSNPSLGPDCRRDTTRITATARRRHPRDEESFPTSTDAATTENPSHALPVRARNWTTDEDTKLKDAVNIHDGKNWAAIAALMPVRLKSQCCMRWRRKLDPIVRTRARASYWTTDEDTKLKDAVHIHDAKNWAAIAALMPGRSKSQCCMRWRKLDPIVRTRTRASSWTTDEDIKLKDAVHIHDAKNWAAIAALMPGRLKAQCSIRWRKYLDPSRSPPVPW